MRCMCTWVDLKGHLKAVDVARGFLATGETDTCRVVVEALAEHVAGELPETDFDDDQPTSIGRDLVISLGQALRVLDADEDDAAWLVLDTARIDLAALLAAAGFLRLASDWEDLLPEDRGH